MNEPNDPGVFYVQQTRCVKVGLRTENTGHSRLLSPQRLDFVPVFPDLAGDKGIQYLFVDLNRVLPGRTS